MARSQQEAVDLFAKAPGLEVSVRSDDHDLEQFEFVNKAFTVASTWQNPFGISTATRGSFPIKNTVEGASPLGTLYVASADRYKGDMGAAILLSDKTVLAQWGRSARPTMIQTGDTVLPVSVFGAPYGNMETSSWGMSHKYVDASGGTVTVVSKGCCQPKSYYMCGACLCFPIAPCIFCMMTSVPALFDLKRSDGSNAGLLKLWQTSTGMSTGSRMVVEYEKQADSQTKLAAAFASLFFIADTFIDPPSSKGNHDVDHGHDGGAPDVVAMER